MHFELINHMEERRVDGIRYAKENTLRKTMDMVLHFLKASRSETYSYRGIVDRLYRENSKDGYSREECQLMLDKFYHSSKLLVTGEKFDDEDGKVCLRVLEELFHPLSKLYYKEDIKIYAHIKNEDSLTYVLPPMTSKNKNSSNDFESEYSNLTYENEFTQFNLAWLEDYFDKCGWKISRKGKRQVDLYMTDCQMLYAVSYLKKHIF